MASGWRTWTGQIGQVIQNLIINADQAMPGGGTPRVRRRISWTGEEGSLPLGGLYHANFHARSRVSVSNKDLPRIFDPFFTTKQKGRGLGLSTAFSIVNNMQDHRGGVHARKEPRSPCFCPPWEGLPTRRDEKGSG